MPIHRINKWAGLFLAAALVAGAVAITFAEHGLRTSNGRGRRRVAAGENQETHCADSPAAAAPFPDAYEEHLTASTEKRVSFWRRMLFCLRRYAVVGQFMTGAAALIVAIVVGYRQFFYERDNVTFLATDFFIAEQLYQGRHLRVDVTFALANSGTRPVILAGMCAALGTRAILTKFKSANEKKWIDVPLAGISGADARRFWQWREPTTDAMPEPILVQPGQVVQRQVEFYLDVYRKEQQREITQTTNTMPWERPLYLQLELVDAKGSRFSSEIRGHWLNEYSTGFWGYAGPNPHSTIVLPNEQNEQTTKAHFLSCAVASRRGMVIPNVRVH